MNKLAKLIETLPPRQLALIQQDLKDGNIERLIARRLAEEKTKRKGVCPVCGSHVARSEGFYVEFGQQTMRMRATLCAKDCLRHFTQKL